MFEKPKKGRNSGKLKKKKKKKEEKEHNNNTGKRERWRR